MKLFRMLAISFVVLWIMVYCAYYIAHHFQVADYFGSYPATVYSTRLGDYRLLITTDKKPLENPYFLYEISRNDTRLAGPLYLGVAYPDAEFDTVVFPNEGILLIVEKHHPHIALVGLDVTTGDIWPLWGDPVVEGEKKRQLLERIRAASNETYEFCDLNSSYHKP